MFERKEIVMKKLLALLLTVFTIMSLSSCKTSDSNRTDSSNATLAISKKQYMTYDESQVYEWKCDVVPTKIKDYSGSPLEGFFITTDDELYEYGSFAAAH